MENTEKKILQAAREEFILTGLKGARMQEIADRAGVNKALLHYYFRSKEKLYEASISEIAETLWVTIEKEICNLSEAPDLKTYIRLFVTSYLHTMSENPLFIRMLMREIADGGTIVSQFAAKIISRFGAVPKGMISTINEEIKKGTIKKIDPVDFFLNMAGMCVITFVAPPITNNVTKQFGFQIKIDEKFYKRRIENIIDTMYNGIFVKEVQK